MIQIGYWKAFTIFWITVILWQVDTHSHSACGLDGGRSCRNGPREVRYISLKWFHIWSTYFNMASINFLRQYESPITWRNAGDQNHGYPYCPLWWLWREDNDYGVRESNDGSFVNDTKARTRTSSRYFVRNVLPLDPSHAEHLTRSTCIDG